MTRWIDLKEVLEFDGSDRVIFFSKETLEPNQLIIAQSESEERWFNVFEAFVRTQLKSGYTMYILSKHIK